MMKRYEDDDFLPISNIQHFAFCRRQWGLIRIEGVWQENFLTAQGRILHERVDDPWFNELRKNMIVGRSMPLISHRLGFQGVADLVEFREAESGVEIKGRGGRWEIVPVEYKRGKPKDEECDALQLCVQAVCLEEMLGAHISRGEIFYGVIRRRTTIDFSPELRKRAEETAEEMHRIFEEGEIPAAKMQKGCKACSLMDVCSPQWDKLHNRVSRYIEEALGEEL